MNYGEDVTRVRVSNPYVKHFNQTGNVKEKKDGMVRVKLDGYSYTCDFWPDELRAIAWAVDAQEARRWAAG